MQNENLIKLRNWYIVSIEELLNNPPANAYRNYKDRENISTIDWISAIYDLEIYKNYSTEKYEWVNVKRTVSINNDDLNQTPMDRIWKPRSLEYLKYAISQNEDISCVILSEENGIYSIVDGIHRIAAVYNAQYEFILAVVTNGYQLTVQDTRNVLSELKEKMPQILRDNYDYWKRYSFKDGLVNHLFSELCRKYSNESNEMYKIDKDEMIITIKISKNGELLNNINLCVDDVQVSSVENETVKYQNITCTIGNQQDNFRIPDEILKKTFEYVENILILLPI